MSEQNKSDSQPSQIPGIAIIALLLGLIWASNEPFQTTRPPMADTDKGSNENVRARLWQDPFDAVAEHRKKYRTGDLLENEVQKTLSRSNSQVAYQLEREPQSMCNTSTAWPDGTLVTWPESRTLRGAHSFENLRCQIQNEIKENIPSEAIPCDITPALAENEKDKQKKIEEFKTKIIYSNKTNCSLLALQTRKSTTQNNWNQNPLTNWDENPFSWTLGGFNEKGEFREILHDKPESELSMKLGDYLSGIDFHGVSNELPNQITAKYEIGYNPIELKVLAVMVPGGPYAEDTERRLRDRYAVISGLANIGYVPQDPEHIGYIELIEKCKSAIKKNDPDKTRYCDWPAFIPYEWFKPIKTNALDDKSVAAPRKVLVLWLENESFVTGAPLSMLNELSRLVTPGPGDKKFGNTKYINIKFDILGPSDSTTLEKMYAEILDRSKQGDNNFQENYKFLENTTIFSSQATKDSEKIIQDLNSSVDIGNFAWLNDRMNHMTLTNDHLAEELICELTRRGVLPFGKMDTNKKESVKWQFCFDAVFWPRWWPKQQLHHIALISEYDTVYSRDLTNTIVTRIGNMAGNDNNTTDTTVGIPESVHVFNYLRGLDGSYTHNNVQSVNEIKPNSESDKENKENLIRRPVGPNQFDYLRRIAERISDLNHSLELKDQGIKAIGILGSDTYDKLLILQALKKQFPNMFFFTTDLDARLIHPAETKWTRNLIVASSYGLTFDNEALQMSAPPFRDGYQTGLYYSTMRAVGCQQSDRCSDVDKLHMSNKAYYSKPLLFEIGNNGAVQLNHTIQSDAQKSHVTTTEIICFFIFLALLVIFVFLQLNADKRVKTLAFIKKIHISYVLLMILFLITILFLSPKINTLLFGYEPFSFTNGTSVWPTNLIMMLAAITAVILIKWSLAKLKESNQEMIREFGIREPDYEVNFWRGSYSVFWGKNFEEQIKIPFEAIWSHYRVLGATPHWLFRVLTILTLYSLLMLMLVYMSFVNLPDIPFRGHISFQISHLILYSTAFVYLFLIFLVSDIVQLNNLFIRQLAKSTTYWPHNCLITYCEFYNLPKNIVKEKFFFDFMIKRTTIVGRLVFYPFLILSLMILSQSYYFDNWYIPLELGILIGLTAMIALSNAMKLSYTVQNVKKEILDRLEHEYLKTLLKSTKKIKRYFTSNAVESPTQVKLLIDEIKEIKTGPLSPLTRHPIVHSIVVPFGGIGGLYLIEYLFGVN